MIYITGEPAALIDFGPLEVRQPVIPVTNTGTYRFLTPHWLSNGVYISAGEIHNPSREFNVPFTPTLAVDPLDPLAVLAFYDAGPRDNSYEDLNKFSGSSGVSAVTFWKPVLGTSMYILTGLGAGLPPRN
jgi:hypothetical protein